jgi:hypothetical protein
MGENALVFSLLFADQFAILVFFDWLRGIPGWGMPLDTWFRTWFLVYPWEWLTWFILPAILMLLWRAWAKKHPEQLEDYK